MTVAKIGTVSANSFCSMWSTADLYTESISTTPLAMALRYTLAGFFEEERSKGDSFFADLIQLKFRDSVAKRSSSL